MQINSSQNNILKNINTNLPKPEQPAMPQIEDRFVSSKGDEGHIDIKKQKNLKDKLLDAASKAFNFPGLVVKKDVCENRVETLLEILQPGDIILTTPQNQPMLKIFEKIVGNSDYTHVAIYEGDGKMIEANVDHKSGFGIDRKDIKSEFSTDTLLARVIRPPYQSQEDVDSSLNYVRDQIGKPYDATFNYENDDSMYCSELVSKSMREMPNQLHMPVRSLLGRNISMPQDVEKIEGSKVLYDDKASFWNTQARMLPAISGGFALAAGAAALALGPAGIAGAMIAGTIVTTVAGGIIQENRSKQKQAT